MKIKLNKNLQLYFSGQVVSQIGTFMQQTALSWLVYRLTGSTVMLGVIGFTAQAPSLVLAPIAGVIADRTNRHKLIMTTQALAMVQAALLAGVVWTNHVQLWQLIVLSTFLGIIAAFDMPIRQSFLADLVNGDKSQLASAIAFMSSASMLTKLIGPCVAGVLVSWVGEGSCFWANCLSYLAVIIALLFVKSKQMMSTTRNTGAFSQLREGFLYKIGCVQIRELLILLALVGLLVVPFSVLMPAFAKDVFHGNAMTLGWLTGMSAFGATLGALFLASKGGREATRWIAFGYFISGVSLIAFGASSFFPLSLFLATISGFGSMIVMSGAMTVIQTVVAEEMRGRVMSFVVMAVLGLGPIGFMAAGALANVVGTGRTVIVDGVLILISSLLLGARVARGVTKPILATVIEVVEEEEVRMTA